MSSVANIVETRLKGKAQGTAEKMLSKLANRNSNQISTITFPTNLENQGQSTYMVIYIFDNVDNKSKFSQGIFDSTIDEESYEIGAINYLKDLAQEKIIDPLKKNLNDARAYIVKTGKDWLNETKKTVDDTVAVNIGYTTTEIKDFVDKYFIPHRKVSESRALKDRLDPTKSGIDGFRLEKAIQIQMPTSPLTAKYENGWESHSTESLNTIRTLFSGIGQIFDGGIGGALKKKNWQAAHDQVSPVMTKIKTKLGDAFTGGGFTADRSAANRFVYNPVLVFNYTIPEPRTFTYSFSLYPRNKDELYNLFELIQTLKFYSLPEISDSKAEGGNKRSMLYRYPAKFSIKFFTNGYENKWLPKTMALGLTSIEETLTGDNGDMAFFENYFDTQSGNPPRLVNLTLTFKELGIMSRDAANAGY